MPPKARISRDMIIEAAFEIARTDGYEAVNVRSVSKKLGCSTQPIMHCFKTIEELKKAVYQKANEFHSEYLMSIDAEQNDIMLGIGLNYIRFAIEESQLFRFLFQSPYNEENSLIDMVNSEEIVPIIAALQTDTEMGFEDTKKVFLTLSMFVHGYASIAAGGSFKYDEEKIAEYLDTAYRGAFLAIKESSEK